MHAHLGQLEEHAVKTMRDRFSRYNCLIFLFCIEALAEFHSS